MRPFALLSALLAVIVLGWLLLRNPDPRSTLRPPEEATPSNPGASDLVAGTGEDQDRRVVEDESETAAPPTTEREDGEPGPPDGFLIRLQDADRQGIPGRSIHVHWRKGWGNYGDDYGVTDADGTFRSTVTRLDQLEYVAVDEEGANPLGLHHPFDPHPLRPREVILTVPRTGRLHGRVVDAAGNGIAHVELEREPLETLSAEPWHHRLQEWEEPDPYEADAEGRFDWEVNEGFHRLSVAAEDQPPMYALEVEVVPGRDEPVELLVHRIEGRFDVLVTMPPDLDHEPWVRLRHGGSEPAERVPGRRAIPASARLEETGPEARPDSTYRFTLPLPVDRTGWTLSAGARGCHSQRTPLSEAGDAPRFTLLAKDSTPPPPRPQLQGRVIDPSGNGLRADLYLNRDDHLRTSSTVRSINHRGEFSIPVDRSGVRYLRVQKSGWERVAVGPILLDEPLPYLEIVLRPALSIEGVFLDANGVPAPCMISLRRSRTQLQRPDGTPLENESGYFDYTFPEDRRGTGDDGEFRFEGVSDRDVRLWFQPTDPSVAAALVLARGGDRLRVTAGQGLEDFNRLEGVLLDALTGAPIPDAHLEARRVADAEVLGSFRAETAADGRFCFPGIQNDRVRIVASAYGYVGLPEEVDLSDGREHWRELRLYPGRTLNLRVRDSAGTPFGGEVSVRDSAGRFLEYRDPYWNRNAWLEYLDRSGRAVLRGLPARRVALVIGWSGDEGKVVHHPGDPEGKDNGLSPFAVEVDLTAPRTEVLDVVLPW